MIKSPLGAFDGYARQAGTHIEAADTDNIKFNNTLISADGTYVFLAEVPQKFDGAYLQRLVVNGDTNADVTISAMSMKILRPDNPGTGANVLAGSLFNEYDGVKLPQVGTTATFNDGVGTGVIASVGRFKIYKDCAAIDKKQFVNQYDTLELTVVLTAASWSSKTLNFCPELELTRMKI
jgi:hypothetical protein